MVPLHVNSPARRIHHHGPQCLRLDSQLTPFCFTHLVTSINPLKLASTLACSRFTHCQLPEIEQIDRCILASGELYCNRQAIGDDVQIVMPAQGLGKVP